LLVSPRRSPFTVSGAKAAVLLGFVTYFSFIYFYQGGGWNQNSRFDLLRAIVERHTLKIDAYHENTGDKAQFQGHYYSDKAPGLVFFAVPFALMARPVMRAAGVDPESPGGEVAISYIATACAVGLPTALASVCLFFLGLRLGSDANGAAFGALAMSLGTPIWAYASLFWAHALVGACLVFGFTAALKLSDSRTAPADFLWALAVGLLAGWATVSEYPAAPASAILAFLALAQAWPHGPGSRWRTAAGIALGAGACLIVLGTYLHAAFGSFRSSYSYTIPTFFPDMRTRGFLGLTYPHIDVVLKLLFGCPRGIFFAAPVALAAPIGLSWLWKDETTRSAAVAASAIAVYYLLFNASYYYWEGGLTYGPRFVGGAIPLLCVGLASAWNRATTHWRILLAGLAVCSISFSLMVVSTNSQLPWDDICPMRHSVWAFLNGRMALKSGSMLTVAEQGSSSDYGSFNLGQRLGLHGLPTLIPLFAVWGIAAILWKRADRDPARKPCMKPM
jgi:hypothetical protein